MARDKWGFGPNFPGYRSSNKGPICSLTLPVECYWVVRQRVQDCVGKVYDHLPGQNGTRKLRVYGSSQRIHRILRELRDSFIPYDLVDEHGCRYSRRCLPDGHYNLIVDPFSYDDQDTSWDNQWHLRSVLKTIRLINCQEFPEPEYL